MFIEDVFKFKYDSTEDGNLSYRSTHIDFDSTVVLGVCDLIILI